MKKTRFPHTVRRGSTVVKIYRVARKSGQVTFTVTWYAAGQRKTRQFSTFTKALDQAQLTADQLNSGKINVAASLTIDDVELLRAARRICGETPVLSALEEYGRAVDLVGRDVLVACRTWAEANAGSVRKIPFSDAVDKFIAAKRRQGVETKNYANILPRLKPAFKGRSISGISARELEKMFHAEFAVGDKKLCHPGTFNSIRKRAVALFRWCRKQGYLPKQAQTEAEIVESMREGDHEIGILKLLDFERILSLIHDEHPGFLAVVVLSCFCGLRRSEIHQQRWDDVHLDRGFVRVTKAKRNTPSKRLVHLSNAAIEWLMLCDRSDELISPPWGVDRVRTFIRRAEIPNPENAFRHSFISYRVAATGNIAETSLEAGNSPSIIHKHYRQLVTKDEGEQWFALGPKQGKGLVSEQRKVVSIG